MFDQATVDISTHHEGQPVKAEKCQRPEPGAKQQSMNESIQPEQYPRCSAKGEARHAPWQYLVGVACKAGGHVAGALDELHRLLIVPQQGRPRARVGVHLQVGHTAASNRLRSCTLTKNFVFDDTPLRPLEFIHELTSLHH